tara:strand:+ start:25436 stop:26191 length:756 start_codon:yes stop_codon:yes gene_type:complete
VIKKVVLYFLVFFLSLLVSLVLLLPATIVWDKFLSTQLNTQQLGINVQKVVGTIWNGQALVIYKGLSGIIHWEVDPSETWMLSLPMSVSVNSQVGKLDAAIKLSFASVQAEIIKAQIDLKPLTPMFKAERVTLDGELFVKNLSVVMEDNKIKSAAGMATWSGGEIAYPAGREVHQRNLPMFKAVIETKKTGEIYLSIRDSQATFDVIDANLTVDGTGVLRITRRLLDLSDEPWSLNSREQDIVFKVKKMLY